MGQFFDFSQADERSLRVTPYGLYTSGKLDPDAALEIHRSSIESAEIRAAVPNDLRKRFERLRQKYLFGVVDYEQFTDVADSALMMYEPVLRARFVEFFNSRRARLVRRDGTTSTIAVKSYDAVHQQIRSEGFVKVETANGPIAFNGTLDGLMRWARAEGLLRGQRARGKERLVARMRNRLSHASSYHILSPVDATLGIRDIAEFVNQLWGIPTPGGRIYPAPIRRDVLAIGWDRPGVRTSAGYANFSEFDDPDWLWVLLKGSFHDPDLLHFDARYAATRLPSEYVWGPGSKLEAMSWLAANRPNPDVVELVDRLFMIRHDGERLFLPQEPAVAFGLPADERGGRWYLVRADVSNDAFCCIRARLDSDPAHANGCLCATEVLGKGSWRHVERRLLELTPELRPWLPPDVRVTSSYMPRFVKVLKTSPS
ncbi:hypothetical protein OOK41_02050 [Micromonospora sp. NBC_01655]|uniref:hypothetical protein n=1 Tax=Micromonospora sp. NBC_01655 TaxID=2975983 RepID=UPI002256479E|nr:hypothetical protein [Micromonospora sp. NBC_01655]MCX4469108.1 hypothetical protein [Micromonospora sp. NBC_01655]